MPRIDFPLGTVMSRYPRVGSADARAQIFSALGTVAEQLSIDAEPNKSAAVVYAGLLHLRALPPEARKATIEQAIAVMKLDEGAETVNASHLKDHQQFIKARCAGLFPGMRAMDRRCAILLYIGATHLKLPLSEPADDWMRTFTFNS